MGLITQHKTCEICDAFFETKRNADKHCSSCIKSDNYKHKRYRHLSLQQRLQIKKEILKDYFSNPDNTPAAISCRTGIIQDNVQRILNYNITSATDLRVLKKQYTT